MTCECASADYACASFCFRKVEFMAQRELWTMFAKVFLCFSSKVCLFAPHGTTLPIWSCGCVTKLVSMRQKLNTSFFVVCRTRLPQIIDSAYKLLIKLQPWLIYECSSNHFLLHHKLIASHWRLKINKIKRIDSRQTHQVVIKSIKTSTSGVVVDRENSAFHFHPSHST